MRPFSTSGSLLNKFSLFVLWSSMLLLFAATADAQSLTVSPGNLSFGIPTITPFKSPATSTAETVTVNITGTGTVTFSSATTTFADFAVTGDSCQGTLTAPTTCLVSVVFTDSSAPATALETATLNIPYSIGETPTQLSVPLSGAYGSIKLFDSTTVSPSQSSASFATPYTIGTASLNLSCPASPTAVLSFTPDGAGNVLVDNYITLSLNGTPVTTYVNGYSAAYGPPPDGQPLAYPLGNICQGSDASPDTFNGNTYPECFSAAYRSNVVPALLGQNTDSITPDGNPLLGDAAGGIPPLNIASLFPVSDGTQSVQPTIAMLDAGGEVASSTLFLATNCSPVGIVPGGSVTGNPITPGNTASQTQTFTFDSAPNQNISFTLSDSVAIQQGTVAATGVTPIVTDIGISQSAFSALLANTSAGPAVCLRLTGEMDSLGNELCKGYLIQCYNPANGTTSGDNCDTQVPGTVLARTLYDSAQFSSPDAPVNDTNFLYNGGATDACTFFVNAQQSTPLKTVTNGSCAPPSAPGPNPTTLIGPGFLLGSDNWLTPSSCSLTGVLSGDLCPLNTLTLFRGAADGQPGGGTAGRNSVYVPVVNMPLPFTNNVSVSGPGNVPSPNGWVNSSQVTASFTSNAATYIPSKTNPNPLPNNFLPAPPYSLTFGITNAYDAHGNPIPLPDTTYPVPGDTTNYNAGVNQNFVAPLCPAGTASSFPSTSGQTLDGLAEGIYNLHYFTTDCALSEGLLFTPTAAQLNDPTANWASFPVLQFGIDTESPVLSCNRVPATSNGTNGWYISDVVETCSATDPAFVAGVSGSGFPPLTKGIQGSPSEVLNLVSTSVGAGHANPTAMLPLEQVTDLAGNPSNSFGPYLLPTDEALPTITSSFSVAGTSFPIGSNVQITYSCADVGSGVANCFNLPGVPGCPAAPAIGAPLVNIPQAISTSPAAFGPHSYAISVTDCAGNVGNNKVNYSISAPAADVFLFEQSTSDHVKPGGTLTYIVWAIDLSQASAYGVNINESIPANVIAAGQHITATVADVSCTFAGCSTSSTGTSCNVSGGTVQCTVGTLPTVFSLKGAMVKITVPVSSSAKVGSTFKITATVSSDNDPNPKNNATADTITIGSSD